MKIKRSQISLDFWLVVQTSLKTHRADTDSCHLTFPIENSTTKVPIIQHFEQHKIEDWRILRLNNIQCRVRLLGRTWEHADLPAKLH